MSSKEISAVTFQPVKSVEIARSRLRKKLNLKRKSEYVSPKSLTGIIRLPKSKRVIYRAINIRTWIIFCDPGGIRTHDPQHYPGTPNEISDTFLQLKDFSACKLKFPALFNYQSIRQQKGLANGLTNIYFNLAFVAPVLPVWCTQEREKKVFKTVLRDIYAEFFNQIKRSRYFAVPTAGIHHEYYEVFTTGQPVTKAMEYLYADYMDAIQIINLQLSVTNICQKDLDLISEENEKVIENFNNLIN
jgi:hypothetical protein